MVEERSQGTRGFTVSAFPMLKWIEWEQDCRDNFGNIYWMKIWNDHSRVKEYSFLSSCFDKIAELEVKIIELESRLDSLSKKDVDEEEKSVNPFKGVTLGG